MQLEPIDQRYLLTVCVPFYIDQLGQRHIDPLWAKDLVEHTKYIQRLTLAASAIRRPVPDGYVAMANDPWLSLVRCVELPELRSWLSLTKIFKTIKIYWTEVGNAQIVHSGVAGWPLPAAWLFVPMLWFRRKFHIIIVESAFWRLHPSERPTIRRRISAAISERLNRACIEQADLTFFTQRQYMESLLTRRRDRGHIVEASWIDAERVLDDATVRDDLLQKRGGPLKLIFAGRLIEQKGCRELVGVVADLLDGGVSISLDIYGDGSQLESCARLIEEQRCGSSVRLCGTLPYTEVFFSALRKYDILVVPSLSDEQPRIVYDAYSQGVPVVASDTPGLSQCVVHGVTGLRYETGNWEALKSTILAISTDHQKIEQMAANCVTRARTATHQRMHRDRWQIIVKAFQRWSARATKN